MKCCIEMHLLLFLEIFPWRRPPTFSYSLWPLPTSSTWCQVIRDLSTPSLTSLFDLARSHIWSFCLLAPVPISLGRSRLPTASLPVWNVSSQRGCSDVEPSPISRSQYCSVLTILAFSCERYVAICQPLYSYTISGVRRTIKIIFLLILLSALSASPFAFFTKINYERFVVFN